MWQDITISALKNLEDLDAINLDLDIIHSDIYQFTDVKVGYEYGRHVSDPTSLGSRSCRPYTYGRVKKGRFFCNFMSAFPRIEKNAHVPTQLLKSV